MLAGTSRVGTRKLERMKIQNRGSMAAQASSTKRMPTRHTDLDALANEIYARLGMASGSDAVSDLQAALARAAETIARPSDVAEEAMRNTLCALPSHQLDALVQRANGMTRAQIAERQESTDQNVLRDLSSAYARLRLSLDVVHQPQLEVSGAVTSQGDAGNSGR